MQFSMWTYPWDVQDLGIDTVIGDLRDRAGLNSVSLATAYHAGRFLQPRSPQRKCYFPEDGTVYFQPTPSRWEKAAIRPAPAALLKQGDALAELIGTRDRSGLAVSCWTVCLHNMRLGSKHPGATTRNAVGDPSLFALCPSNPDVREYAATLVEDISRTYQPDTIELETPSFMGYAHGFHHEKDGVGLTAEDDLFFSLCFCPACVARSARAGVDAEAARRTVAGWIAQTCEREVPQPRFPDFASRGIEVFRPHPEVYEYLSWRFEPVTSLIAEMRERAAPATKVYVIDLAGGWRDGCDTAAIARVCDGVLCCAYDMQPEEVGSTLAQFRSRVGPDKYLGAGFRLFFPEMRSAEDIVARVKACVAAGATGINFYNYGLVPAARLDWARRAVEAVRA